MIRLSRIVRLQRFLAQDYRPSTDVFAFPPYLFRAVTLPWETVET